MQPVNRAFRLFIFLGFLVAASLILYGFFFPEWRTSQTDPLRGFELAELTVEQFDTLLQLQGQELNPQLLQDLLDGVSEDIRSVVNDGWTSVGVYFVVFLGGLYAIRTVIALIFLLGNVPFSSLGCVGLPFAIIGTGVNLAINLALPVFILLTFRDNYLPNDALIGQGYWLTLAGVVIGALTPILGTIGQFSLKPRRAYFPQQQRQQEIYTPPGAFPDDLEVEARHSPDQSSVFPDGDIDDLWGQRGKRKRS
jgi:hypothetical protein